MTAATQLSELRSLGATPSVAGGRIRIEAPKGALSSELLAELQVHKGELIDLLTWPEECLESERQHGHPGARLYPLRGRTVQTPMGSGRLVAALPERVVVVLARRSHPAAFLPDEVGPTRVGPREAIRCTVH